MKQEVGIVGPDGNPVQSDRFASCPKCGQGPDKRFPSAGFGSPHLVCPCGYEFPNLLVQQQVVL
jgi:hypothetical protein